MTGTPPKISLDAVYWKTSVSSTIVENPLLESFQTGVKREEEKMWHGLIPRALRWRPRRSSPCAGPGGTAEEWHRCPQGVPNHADSHEPAQGVHEDQEMKSEIVATGKKERGGVQMAWQPSSLRCFLKLRFGASLPLRPRGLRFDRFNQKARFSQRHVTAGTVSSRRTEQGLE